MSCNCKQEIFVDEDLRRWETSCSVPYYTKAEIDEKLENIDISGDCMSSGDVQNMIDASVSHIEGSVEALSGSVVQLSTDMENKADRSEIPSLSGYATQQWVNNKGYAYLSEVQALDRKKQGKLRFYEENISPDTGKIEVYHNIIEVNTDGLYLYTNPYEPTNAYLNNSPILTEDTVSDIINQYLENKADASAVTAVNDALTAHTSNSTIHVTATDKTNWNGKANVVELTQAEYDELTVKDPDTIYIISDAPAMPPYEAGTGIAISGNVISCTVTGGGGGDMSNYYTKSETDGLLSNKLDASAYTPSDLSQYWTSAETQSAIDDAISGITGITIDQNLDSGSTNAVANSAITQAINAKADQSNTYTKTEVNNVVNNKFWCGTQNEYDALVNKENGVLYLIYEI